MSRRPLSYSVDLEQAETLLTEPAATLAGRVYQAVVVAHHAGAMYVPRGHVTALVEAEPEDVDEALTTLEEEELLLRARIAGEYYYPAYCDDGREAQLAFLLANFAAVVAADEWLLGVLLGPVALPAPGPRSRPSLLAETVLSA